MDESEEQIPYIRLDQFLKFRGLAETGGQAKTVIQQGFVSVNGETEKRRGRKLIDGDVVDFDGQKFEIEFMADDEPDTSAEGDS